MNRLSFFGRYTLLCIASLTIMVGSVVAPGLSSISQALGMADHASLLITLPSLGVVLFAPIAGRLIDRYGAYNCTLIGLLMYGLLGLSGQWLFGPIAVAINRIALGAATAIVMAGGTTLISQFYSGHERLTMIAKQGMAIELGGVIVLFLGGQLAVQGWNLPFYIYAMAWAFFVMLMLFVPKKPPSPEENIAPETHSDASRSGLMAVYVSSCVAMTLFFSAFVVLPLSMQGSGYSADQVGIFLAFISLVAVVTAHFLPKVNKRIKDKGTLAFAFAFFSFAHIAFYFGEALPILIIGGVLAGMGFGFSIPLFNHITVERSAPEVRGKNLSYLAMAIFLGQFLTSFMELIPGNHNFVYLVAAVGGAVYFFCVLKLFKTTN